MTHQPVRCGLAPTRLKSLPLLCLTASLLALGACSDDDDNGSPASAATAAALPLATRDDVITAVAGVWAFSQELYATEPRPSDPDGATEGVVTVDCPDGGSVTYDEDQKITTIEQCTTNSEDAEGNITDTLVLNGVLTESCDADVQQSTEQCVNAEPYREDFTSEAADESLRRDTAVGFVQLENGVQLLINDVSRREFRFEEEEPMEGSSDGGGEGTGTKVTVNGSFDFSAQDFRIINRTSTEEDPDTGETTTTTEIELDGEVLITRGGSLGAATGAVRIGTAQPLVIGDDIITAGSLVLSSTEVGALVINFDGSGGISFRLDGNDETATAEEIGAASYRSYFGAPGETGSEEPPAEDPGSDCPIDPLPCPI